MRHSVLSALLTCAFALATSACSKPEVKPTPTQPTALPRMEVVAPPESAPAAVVEQIRQNFRKVLFDFDQAQPTRGSLQYLEENATLLRRHPGVRVQLEGHTDHFGTTEYNMALGERRATTVRRYLQDRGVPAAQLGYVSFGKERPIVGNGGKDAVAPDRRVEFRVVSGDDDVESSYGPSDG